MILHAVIISAYIACFFIIYHGFLLIAVVFIIQGEVIASRKNVIGITNFSIYCSGFYFILFYANPIFIRISKPKAIAVIFLYSLHAFVYSSIAFL